MDQTAAGPTRPVEHSMVKVECDGCGAPYQIDEKRVPPAGLKMRCPKCGKNLLVTKPSADSDLPAVPDAAAKQPPRPGGKPPPPLPGKAKPPAPPRPAPKVDDLEMPAGSFGEIDLGVDLPSLETDAGQDLPAVATGAAAGKPPPFHAARPAAFGEPAFGEPAFGEPAFGEPAFGEADIGVPEIDLPSVSAASDLPARAFGHADLPARAFGQPDLPAPAFARAELPSPAQRDAPGAPPRRQNRTVNFGDIDLPIAPATPPPPPPGRQPEAARPARGRTVNFGDIDLPSLPDDFSADGGGFGELDLPLVADGTGLPSPSHGPGLPLVAQTSLPSPYGAGLPAVIAPGFPVASQSTGLPMPAQGAGLPMPAQGAGLPVTAGAGLPLAAGAGLPLAAGAGLPLAAGAGLPLAAGAGLPLAAGAGLPMTSGAGLPAMQGAGFPVAAHDGLPMALEAGLPTHAFGDSLPTRSNAFDDSDRAVPAGMDPNAALGPVGIDVEGGGRATVGSEEDLAAPSPDVEPQAPSQRRPRTAEPEAPVKKSRAGRVAILVGVVVAISGGALTLVPSVGPFGAHFILDKVNAKTNTAKLDELRAAVGTQLDADTYASASAAIAQCRSTRAAMPRFQPAAAYCAFLTLERDVRFGRSTEDEAFAKQLLADASEDGSDWATAATAELDLLSGQVPKARTAVASLVQKSPQDVDFAVLAASIDLADKAAGKAAVGSWTQAVGLHKSARTLFGLARADAAAEDAAGAEKNARDALAASKAHAGARVLIASLTGADPTKETAALALLKEVTDKGGPPDGASDAERVAAFTEVGGIHLGRSRMSAAEQAFAAALKINPLAIAALVGNGELFYRSGRYSEAQSRFEAASNADPESVIAKVGIAKTFIALERMKEAKDLLKKLGDANATDPLVSLWRGRAEEVLGNKKDAEGHYLQAIKIGGTRPAVVDAYVALVRLLGSIGRTDDANAKLAEASKRFPDLPALHRARGELALQLGRFEEARVELDTALSKVEDLGTRFHLGVTLRRMRRYQEATAEFDKVGAIDVDYPGLALERGVISQETGQTERALELYRKALEKAPNDIDLKLRVGQTQVLAGHPLEAEKILEEVRHARPNSAEANHYLGRVLLAKGENLAEAARFLELAAQIDGNRPEYHLYVGWAANEQAQAGKAGPALNRALELDHDLGDAYWQRGVLLQKQGATTDALRDLRTALEKNPSRFEAWATIAFCDQDLQKYDEAEKAWRSAIAGNPDVAEWHYRLGKLLRDHGARQDVAAEMDKAVTLGERPNQKRNAWLLDAHFLLAEALRTSPADKAKAIENYQRFLALAPPGNVYRKEAEDALRALGAPPQ